MSPSSSSFVVSHYWTRTFTSAGVIYACKALHKASVKLSSRTLRTTRLHRRAGPERAGELDATDQRADGERHADAEVVGRAAQYEVGRCAMCSSPV